VFSIESTTGDPGAIFYKTEWDSAAGNGRLHPKELYIFSLIKRI